MKPYRVKCWYRHCTLITCVHQSAFTLSCVSSRLETGPRDNKHQQQLTVATAICSELNCRLDSREQQVAWYLLHNCRPCNIYDGALSMWDFTKFSKITEYTIKLTRYNTVVISIIKQYIMNPVLVWVVHHTAIGSSTGEGRRGEQSEFSPQQCCNHQQHKTFMGDKK